jgi:hypothetical protein
MALYGRDTIVLAERRAGVLWIIRRYTAKNGLVSVVVPERISRPARVTHDHDLALLFAILIRSLQALHGRRTAHAGPDVRRDHVGIFTSRHDPGGVERSKIVNPGKQKCQSVGFRAHTSY